MPNPNHTSIKRDTSSAVSEIIGAILLISLVVSAVMIVGVFIFSQQTPEEIPNINFMTGTDGQGNLSLFHNGGDSLTIGEFSVNVDQTPRPYTLAEGGSDWSLGKTLVVTGVPSGSHTVQIIYNNTESGGAVLLRTASANISMSTSGSSPDIPPIPVPTPTTCINASDPQEVLTLVLQNVSVIGDAMNQSPSTIGPVIANVIGANSISFYKDDRVSLTYTGANYFKFNVTKTGSSISATDFGGTPVTLYPGDIVTVYFRSNTGIFKTFGLGDELWELSATGVDVNITHNGIPDRRTNGDVIHAWITGYQDLGSTMTIVTNNPYTSGTALVINGTQWINGNNGDNVLITNIRPVGVGLFLLEGDNNAHIVYFVGNAQSVTRNGHPCTGIVCSA